MAAISIGGMVIARTIEGRILADQLRTACTNVVGGWSGKRKVKRPHAGGKTAKRRGAATR